VIASLTPMPLMIGVGRTLKRVRILAPNVRRKVRAYVEPPGILLEQIIPDGRAASHARQRPSMSASIGRRACSVKSR
jgi:hypothetical protein